MPLFLGQIDGAARRPADGAEGHESGFGLCVAVDLDLGELVHVILDLPDDAADVVIGVLGIAAVAVEALGLGDDGNLVSHIETGHERDIVCLGLEHDELVLGARRRLPFDEL